MELLYDVSQVAITSFDGTSMIAHLRDLSAKLQEVYDFENVEDTLAVVNDGTNTVQVTGSISLWIGSGARIYIYVYRYNNSSNYYKLHPRIAVSGIVGTYYTFSDGGAYATSGASETMYHAYAIYKTRCNHLILSQLQSNSANSTPSSKGLCLMIGTATNVYTNEKLPTLLSFRYNASLDWYYNGSWPDYLNGTQSTNQYCMTNSKFQQTSVVSLPCTWSDIAVVHPVISQNGHWVMDDMLVAAQVPHCFSNSTSVVEYEGHTYAQVGRYLFLDENDSED